MKALNPEDFLILVVDDLKQNLKLLEAILDKAGYDTTFATSGQQALDRVEKAQPDLILLDLMMPEMDGLEVCKRLQANPETREIPIIFLTASQEKELLLQAFDHGATDYVTKPFSSPELLARIRTHLTLKKTTDELKKTLAELLEARESALETARFKSQFLANMSHEIRTPMNAVIGLTDLLMITPLNDQQRDFVQTLKFSGEALLNIINDILDLSKLEAGEVKIDPHEFNLYSVLQGLVDLFIIQAKQKGLDFQYHFDANLPNFLVGDSFRLRQVLSNLISNAIKFTEKGEVKIKVFCQEKELDKVLIKVTIQDTGIGISPSDQEKLFQAFSQVDTSTTRQYGGTGLGLAICQQLVQLMGGEIGVESVLGQGSKFWFTVPFKPSLSQDGQKEVKLEEIETTSAAPPNSCSDSCKLLVVEDVRINQKVIRHQLNLLGYHADLVSNGQEALDTLEKHFYDLVFMDCQMPVLDGYQATQMLRQREEKEKVSVVIGLTANAMKGDREKCLKAGMDDYLTKPVTLDSLSNILEKWLPQSVRVLAE